MKVEVIKKALQELIVPDIQKIISKQNELSIEIKRLDDKIDSVKNEINSVRNEIDSVRNEINSVRNEINSVRNEMEAMRNELYAQISRVEEKLILQMENIQAGFRSEITPLKAKIETALELRERIIALESKVETLLRNRNK